MLDVDIYLLKNYQPELLWVLDYRFFIFLGGTAVMLVLLGTAGFVLWAGYILSYPFILLFWKIPSFIFRLGGWVLALAVTEFVFSFFRSFRYHVIMTALFMIALVVVMSSHDAPLLYAGSAILFALLLVIYLRALFRVFKPTNLFQIHRKIFAALRQVAENSGKLDAGIKDLPVASLSPTQLGRVLINRDVRSKNAWMSACTPIAA